MAPAVDVSGLIRSLDHWEHAAWLATALVTVGVAGESVHSFTSWFKRFPWWADKGNKVSGLVLIAALALEFLTGVMTNTISDQLTKTLSKQAADATLNAANLGVTVNNVQTFVQQKEQDVSDQMVKFQGLANAVNNQMATFKRVASAQKAQAATAISSLNADKKGLDASIATIKQDEAELTSRLAAIRRLREQVHSLTTHRVLTQQQWVALTTATKQSSSVQFDVAAVHDSDSPDLAFQIGVALKNAGWDWVARNELDSLRNLTYPNLPAIGGAFTTGLQVIVCDSDVHAFGPALDALHAALLSDNLDIKPIVLVDTDAKARNDKCGMLHIVVGSRT